MINPHPNTHANAARFVNGAHALKVVPSAEESGLDLAACYRDKRILITGGLGFLGSTLAHRLCGYGAGELISEAVIALEMGATAKDIALSIHPHPTLTETISEAAETLHGLSSHIYIKRPQVL
mgnify:CR=1 FL=1